MKEKTERLLSLDIFRGITIFLMLIVSNQGNYQHSFHQLLHARWHGCTLTDLVFPFFLFIVGVTTFLSTTRKMALATPHSTIMYSAFKRMVILFVIGVLLHIFPFFDTFFGTERWHVVRIMGVLQRIGITYFLATLCLLTLSRRGRWILMATILLGYYLIMIWIPVPGSPLGVPNPLTTPYHTWTSYLDRALIWGTIYPWYKTWDPEGILSTFPALVTVLSGVWCGEWLSDTRKSLNERMKGMIWVGVAAVILAALWNPFFPINKKIWTSSYVLLTGGLGVILLAAIMWCSDLKKIRKPFAFFVWYGVNPIFAYIGFEMLTKLIEIIKLPVAGQPDGMIIRDVIYIGIFGSYSTTPLASATYSLLYSFFWAGILWFLYRRKIFFKI